MASYPLSKGFATQSFNFLKGIEKLLKAEGWGVSGQPNFAKPAK
jgi:hypothetical protein